MPYLESYGNGSVSLGFLSPLSLIVTLGPRGEKGRRLLATSEFSSAYTAIAWEKRKAQGLEEGVEGSTLPKATELTVLESTSFLCPAPITPLAPYQ